MKLSNKEMRGCDISYHQGAVDFNIMKSSGIEFVMIRAGYGTTIDKRFITYINNAISAGLHVGVYWFIYAANTAIAKQNAEKCDSVIKAYKDKIDMGVFADFEYDSDKKAGNNLTVKKRSDIVETFLSTLSKKGYDIGNYTNPDYINNKFSKELNTKYQCWLARYSKTYGNMANKIKDNKPYIWQYTSKEPGKKHGVSSKYLDMDIAYIDLPKKTSTTTVIEQKTTTIVKASDNPYLEPQRSLYYKKPMMNGDDVKWLQWHLWRFSLIEKKEIDGYFGIKTKQALGTLQSLLKVSKDYIAGPKTKEAVKKI